MKAQLTHRLAQLKMEYETGQKMLADLEAQQRTLRDTLLRISGAIQVLEEMLGSDATPQERAEAQPDGPLHDATQPSGHA
jgi:hypothetical protein